MKSRAMTFFDRESAWSSPAFVRVLDQTPPPAPFCLLDPQPGPGVPAAQIATLPLCARYLESGDPDLTPSDQALIAAHSGPVTLVEWNWLPEQQAVAPDTKEFRVYLHPRFRSEQVTISSIGVPTDTAVSVTLSGSPSFNAIGGELTWHGRSFLVGAQSGAALSLVPNRIGRADGSVELVVPSTGLAQIVEGTRDPKRWQDRIHVEPLKSPPASYYRAVIPGEKLSATAIEPLATAWIGVTAVDNKTYIPDDPARTGPLANRMGNESPLAMRQQIHAVHRAPPPAGPIPSTPQFATRADFFGRSRCRVTFPVMAPARYHVWRAVESSILATDLTARKARRGIYQANDPFAEDPGFSAWLASEFPAVTTSALVADPLSDAAREVWEAWSSRFHARAIMTDSLLQTIAGRAPNESAFAQLTREPLSTGAYDDEFDGRISGRYVYRMQAVFPNGLRGPLSAASLPVRLHDVLPPRSPVISRITLADRAATVSWTTSPDADIEHYEVYSARRDPAVTTLDPRRMTRVGGNLPPGQTSITDSGLVPTYDYVYVVVAVDACNNRSQLSEPRSARAIGTSGPPPPVLTAMRVADGIDLAWTGAEEGSQAMVERKVDGQTDFARITAWLEPGVATFRDRIQSDLAVDYRIKLLDAGGNQSGYSATINVAAV